ncbi:MAG: hypothetical protein ACLQDY_18080 [Streptosporangiaceae bacterium]
MKEMKAAGVNITVNMPGAESLLQMARDAAREELDKHGVRGTDQRVVSIDDELARRRKLFTSQLTQEGLLSA